MGFGVGDMIIIPVRVLCFLGAAWCVSEVIGFLWRFDYSEFGKANRDGKIIILVSFVVTLVIGLFPVVALTLIGVHLPTMFQ